MIRFLSNIPIFRRLFFAFALATLIPALIIALLGNFYINSFSTLGSAVKISFDAQSTASQQETNLQRMNALLQAKFYQIFASDSNVVTDPSLFASGGLVDGEIRALEADFSQNLTTYQNQYEVATSSQMSGVRTILTNDDPTDGPALINSQQLALNQIIGNNQAWVTYQTYQDQELGLLEKLQTNLQNHVVYTTPQINADYQHDYSILHNAILAFTNLKNGWQQVADDAVQMGKDVTQFSNSQIQPIILSTIAAFLSIILVIVATAYVVYHTITRPLSQLAIVTENISGGDTSARAAIEGRDEIAKVASAVNNMLDHILQLIQDAQAQRHTLEARVEKLVTEVSGVGEGDLRMQAEVTSDTLGVLADSFNYMVEELSGLIVRVKKMAHEVENSTSLTFQSMVQLVGNADVRLQQIGKAAQEVERMASTNREVAERASSLAIVATDARRTAQNGRESVHQTIEGMGRIQLYVQDTSSKVQALGNSSREIEAIVGAIATIAHQTNRLALDAAVQAATAGENGKGFGVVATDIRRLAERAKEQASQISHIVRNVSENIDAAAISMKDTEHETSIGTNLAKQTGLALESIFNAVDLQNNEIEVINQMAKHQSESSSSIVRIMQVVSDSTQQSSSSTRGAARNMEHLALLAEQLLASVEAFKLNDGSNNYDTSNQMLMVGGPQYTAIGAPTSTEINPYRNAQPISQWDNKTGPLTPQPQSIRSNSSGSLMPQSQNARGNFNDPFAAQNQNPRSNFSGSLNAQNQNPRGNSSGSLNAQNQNPRGKSSGSLNPQNQQVRSKSGEPLASQTQKQAKLKQNRLQHPPTPPEL